jgi:hypothetical protein
MDSHSRIKKRGKFYPHMGIICPDINPFGSFYYKPNLGKFGIIAAKIPS